MKKVFVNGLESDFVVSNEDAATIMRRKTAEAKGRTVLTANAVVVLRKNQIKGEACAVMTLCSSQRRAAEICLCNTHYHINKYLSNVNFSKNTLLARVKQVTLK